MLRLFNKWGHRRFSDLLTPYMDNRLDEALLTAFEGHIASCAQCTKELGDVRATVGLLRSLPKAVPQRSFAIIDEPQAARSVPRYLWGMRAATAMASVALVLLVAGDLTGIFSRDVSSVSQYGQENFSDSRMQGTAIAEGEEDLEGETDAPSMSLTADNTPLSETTEVPDAKMLTEPTSQEAIPVTTLEIALGSLLAVLVLTTFFATRRLGRI